MSDTPEQRAAKLRAMFLAYFGSNYEAVTLRYTTHTGGLGTLYMVSYGSRGISARYVDDLLTYCGRWG